MSSVRFQVTGPHVVHDEIDGEVVVINFATGSYYSLTATAVPVWAGLRVGATAADAVAALEAGFDTGGEDVEAAVDTFLARLEDEGLIAPTVDGAAPSGAEAPFETRSAPDPRPLYVAPVLEKFTDMEDLILLDPVHDVSQAGWPNPSGTAGSGATG
jgi:Coenzyme PQQ synthesis protein D (PqqD)